jgi:hypothetical protein
VQSHLLLRTGEPGSHIPNAAFLLARCVLGVRDTVKRRTEQRDRQGADGLQQAAPQTRAKGRSVVVVGLVEAEPAIGGERAAKDAEIETRIGETVKAAWCLGPAVDTACQQALDDISAGGTRKNQEILALPLTLGVPVILGMAIDLTGRDSDGQSAGHAMGAIGVFCGSLRARVRVTSQKLRASPKRPAPARGSGRATAEPSRAV